MEPKMDVILPKVALTMADAKVAEWYCQVGDHVDAGQPLFSMETDKATVDVEAPASGTVATLVRQVGDVVMAGDVVAVIDPTGETQSRHRVIPAAVREVAPAAAELAAMLGLDIAGVVGTGPGGRVLEADVIKASSAVHHDPASVVAETLNEPPSAPAENSRARASGLKLTERVGSIPIFFLAGTLEFTSVWDRMQAEGCTVTDVVTVATARALKDVPTCHARLAEDGIRIYQQPRIGILIKSGDALVPIVLPDPSGQSPAEVRRSRKELMRQLGAGHLDQKHLWWPTFVISNLGRYNVEAFTAVLFPETAVTLAVGALNQDHPPRRALRAVLTCDHRIVDGVDASMFMSAISARVTGIFREAASER
jgi:pyruvate dehydrogenase E2 component (dihydrolipoyllysine-residue acetyltransferase)